MPDAADYVFALGGPFLEDGPHTVVIAPRAAVARGGARAVLPDPIIRAVEGLGFAHHADNAFARAPGLSAAAVAERLGHLGIAACPHLQAILATPIAWD